MERWKVPEGCWQYGALGNGASHKVDVGYEVGSAEEMRRCWSGWAYGAEGAWARDDVRLALVVGLGLLLGLLEG